MYKCLTPQDFVDKLPIEQGDALLIASDVVNLTWNALKNKACFDLNELINCLQKKVSKEGTLLFPTYNWGFCQGKTFDYHKTRSLTGALSQIALKRHDFIRTKHALYSFAVWGKDQKVLYSMEDGNSFVGDTPFAYLHHNKYAKMLMINVSLQNSFTFVHYVEEICNAKYRFLKIFKGKYIDENNIESIRSYSMYVRDLEINGIVDTSGLEKLLLEKKLMTKMMLESNNIMVLKFLDAYREIENDIVNNEAKSIVRFA